MNVTLIFPHSSKFIDFIMNLIAHESVKLGYLQVEETYICTFSTLAVSGLVTLWTSRHETASTA